MTQEQIDALERDKQIMKRLDFIEKKLGIKPEDLENSPEPTTQMQVEDLSKPSDDSELNKGTVQPESPEPQTSEPAKTEEAPTP